MRPTQGTAVANSKQVGGLVGPTLVAILVSEFPLVQPRLYDTQIPPVVYLSGVLLFVAGLAVVRSHNVWARNRTVLITLSGCFSLRLAWSGCSRRAGICRQRRALVQRLAALPARTIVRVLPPGVAAYAH